MTRPTSSSFLENLLGAIDIVFVEQKDGRFKSTPFFIKFGKIGVLQSKEKVIYIEVNGKEIGRTMVLDDSGVASFPDQRPREIITREQLSRRSSFNSSRLSIV